MDCAMSALACNLMKTLFSKTIIPFFLQNAANVGSLANGHYYKRQPPQSTVEPATQVDEDDLDNISDLSVSKKQNLLCFQHLDLVKFKMAFW